MCHILFIRSKSLGPIHVQGEEITCEAGITWCHLRACWPLMFFQPSDFWLPCFNSFILFLIFFSSLGQLGHFGAVIQITFRTLGLTFFSGQKFEHGLYLMEIVKTQSMNSVVQSYSHLKQLSSTVSTTSIAV